MSDYLQEQDVAEFLAWDPDCGSWSVVTVAELREQFEHAHYNGGFGAPSHLYLLPGKPEGASTQPDDVPPAGSPPLVAVWPVVTSQWTDGDDYMHSTHEVRDASGKAHGYYAMKLDGRS